MKEKTIVSTVTLVSSLLAYWYAKQNNKDSVPYLMIGGFVGAVAGELLFEKLKSKKMIPDTATINIPVLPDDVNGIYDAGNFIRVVLNGSELLICKAQIKTMDTIRKDTVRINIGEGPLRNIYIKVTDVTVPAGLGDAIALRDALLKMMPAGSMAGIDLTKLESGITELQQIKTLLSELKLAFVKNVSDAGGFASKFPLREDESQPGVVYKGYAVPDALTSQPIWAIVKISKLGDTILYEWADGNQNYDNIWDNRLNLSYATDQTSIIALP